MTRYAVFEEADALFVVGLLLKLEGTTVLHELLKFGGVTFTKLSEGSLNLLLLDSSILFVFRSAR